LIGNFGKMPSPGQECELREGLVELIVWMGSGSDRFMVTPFSVIEPSCSATRKLVLPNKNESPLNDVNQCQHFLKDQLM
jgi:hypothetical protein